MKGSLQEQLLKSGLINEDQLKNVKKPKKKYNRTKRKNPQITKTAPLTSQPVSQPPPVKEIKQEKALRGEVKKLLRSQKLNNKTGEIAYNYTINNQIKRFFVTEAQQKDLVAGNLAIANWNDISYLIPSETASDLRKLYPKINICLLEPDKKGTDDNDPYADFVIPDDISW